MNTKKLWHFILILNLVGLVALTLHVFSVQSSVRHEINNIVDLKIKEKEQKIIDHFSRPTIEIYKSLGKSYEKPETLEDLLKMMDEITK